MAGSCAHATGSSGFNDGGKFLDQVRQQQLPTAALCRRCTSFCARRNLSSTFINVTNRGHVIALVGRCTYQKRQKTQPEMRKQVPSRSRTALTLTKGADPIHLPYKKYLWGPAEHGAGRVCLTRLNGVKMTTHFLVSVPS